ncbi:MAG: acyl-CoA thioesterase [Candidatus Obscuribacterales bacterium]|nr:acyl-CoA thioesterase [Candidatus Obscuribacterales bacterium]
MSKERPTVSDTREEVYKSWVSINLRYGDTDRQGHINNAVYCTLMESGRVDFLFDGDRAISGEGTAFVIAKLSIDYLFEMHFPGIARVGSRIISIGKSSFTVGQAIYYNGKCCSTAESVIVMVDELSGKSRALPEQLRHKLESLK